LAFYHHVFRLRRLNHFVLARIIHILAVVLWIGGVSFVTLSLIPVILKDLPAPQRLHAFERYERLFAWQARVTTFLAGASGFYMLHVLNGWDRLLQGQYWWLQLMVLVWTLFTVLLFIAEPLFLEAFLRRQNLKNPVATMARIRLLHIFLLTLSLLAIFGGVGGSHGMF